ncbi:hypothetical protein FGO68_gene10832 [Halteria grandinella]|uniref:phosphoacetylglucosamine mutase n=1 Tax=Halteria grandinella TaxID=5974 RepID=A0A8J8T407_HALGN|nr:hypothetical protein FGO68_gene10832 [Halteria grandinella]
MLKRIAAADATYKAFDKRFAYGTAGFRTLGETLDRVCFRAGVLAGIRAKMDHGLAGVMVTASHNPKQDNGLKIFEKDGAMLEGPWEKLAESLVNTDDLPTFLTNLNAGQLSFPGVSLHTDFFAQPQGVQPPLVFIGMDTRDSSQRLIDAVSQGITLIGACPVNYGLVTTPQLHWLTQRCNELRMAMPGDGEVHGKVKKEDFNEAWARYFKEFSDLIGDSPKSRYETDLLLDCANGVGSIQFKLNLELMAEIFGGKDKVPLNVTIINDDEKPDLLNEECGAEYVHKDQQLPHNFALKGGRPGIKCASFDGDADRLIYFYQRTEGDKVPVIIDGDKQFALILMYIKSLLEKLGITHSELTHVFVQTAYVNSRSTKFLKAKGINNELCPTGVKNAHPIVVGYDIGANDEPNGHGTIVCKWDRVRAALESKKDSIEAKKIQAILQLSNMTVGDAIANLLLIESILRDLDMSIADFATLYEENPSRMFKAVVKDRTKFNVVWDESRLTQPIELQNYIDALVSQTTEGKAFVRPSGTEDILRLYAEAKTMEEMEALAKAILKEIDEKYKDY